MKMAQILPVLLLLCGAASATAPQPPPRNVKAKAEPVGPNVVITLSYQVGGNPDSVITRVNGGLVASHRLRAVSPHTTTDAFTTPRPAPGVTINGLACVQSKKGGQLSQEVCSPTPWSYKEPEVLPPPIVNPPVADTIPFAQNEPAGYYPIGAYEFNSVSTTGNPRWYNATGSWSFVSPANDASARSSPPGVVQHTYPIGTSGGNFPLLDWAFPAQSELYLRGWIKLSKPWDYHTSTVNKLLFVGTNQNSSVNNEVVLTLKGSAESSAQIRGIAQEPVQNNNDYLLPNVSAPGFSLGVWHQLELQLIRNTGGQANGIMRWWVDGRLVGDHNNVIYNTVGDGAFNRVVWQHYWGGNQDTKGQTDYIWDDNLYISGRTPPPPGGRLVFEDTFRNGQRAMAQNGVSWTGIPSPGIAVVADPGSASGYALQFPFGPDAPGEDSNAEQRFRMPDYTAVTVEKEVYVPPNYVHRDDVTGGDNNKGLRLWDEHYESGSSTVHVGFSTRSRPDGTSQLHAEYKKFGVVGTGGHGLGPYTQLYRPNTVVVIRYAVKVASGPGAADGIIKMWVNGVQVLDATNLMLTNTSTATAAANVFRNGYVFGWANSGFTAETKMNLRRFAVWEGIVPPASPPPNEGASTSTTP